MNTQDYKFQQNQRLINSLGKIGNQYIPVDGIFKTTLHAKLTAAATNNNPQTVKVFSPAEDTSFVADQVIQEDHNDQEEKVSFWLMFRKIGLVVPVLIFAFFIGFSIKDLYISSLNKPVTDNLAADSAAKVVVEKSTSGNEVSSDATMSDPAPLLSAQPPIESAEFMSKEDSVSADIANSEPVTSEMNISYLEITDREKLSITETLLPELTAGKVINQIRVSKVAIQPKRKIEIYIDALEGRSRYIFKQKSETLDSWEIVSGERIN